MLLLACAPGMFKPTTSKPARAATSMYTSAKVMGMPARFSST